MTATQVQLTGGSFEDAEGNVLANGYLKFVLSQDGSVPGVGNICSGITITIQLDSAGNAASSASTPAAADQYIWGNDVISPNNTFYRVTGYTAAGQPAWGPNNQQVIGSSPFNLGTWIPNQVFSWNPPVSAPVVEVNGTQTQDQNLLNLTAGSGITIVDEGSGEILISASGGGYPSGANVVAPLPVLASATASLNGYTVVLRIPASYVQAFTTAGIKVGVQTTSTTGLVLHAASIGLTLPGSTTWTSGPTAMTWPAGAFASANTLYLSNACPIVADAAHDIYIMIAWDSTSATGSAYADQSTSSSSYGWAIYGTPTQLAGYIVGNHTADADASSIQAGGLAGTSIFCIQQVKTA